MNRTKFSFPPLLWLFGLLSFSSGNAVAQTILNPGDVQITGFRSDDPDGLSFVTWVPLADGTQILFTDNGWAASDSLGFSNTSESWCTWTNNTGSTLASGTVVSLVCSGGGCVANVGAVAGSLNGLSVSGDQIFAFQGSLQSASLLYGLNFDGADWATDRTNTNNSALPLLLAQTGAESSIPEVDNAEYSGSRSGLALGQYFSLIADAANWNLENDGALLAVLNSTNFSGSSAPLPQPDFTADSLIVEALSSESVLVRWKMPNPTPAGTAPSGLLIRLSNSTWPSPAVDGVPPPADSDFSDGQSDMYVSAQDGSISLNGLAPGTLVYASLHAFTNQGSAIDFLNSSPLLDSVKTPLLPYGPGDLRISEICDAPFFVDEFIELVNLSSVDLPTSGLKLVRMSQSPPYNVEYIFDFGLESTLDTMIPAGGIAVVCRGSSDRASFEAAWGGPMDSSVAFVRGTGGLYFGTSTPRRWRLRYGGQPDQDDGLLFDDTDTAVGGAVRVLYSMAQDKAFLLPSTSGTPGTVEERIHTVDGWLGGHSPDTIGLPQEVYIHSGTTQLAGDHLWSSLTMRTGTKASFQPNSSLRLTSQGFFEADSRIDLLSNSLGYATYSGPEAPIYASVSLTTTGQTGRWMYFSTPTPQIVDSLLSDFDQVNYATHPSPSAYIYDGVDFAPLSSGTLIQPGQGLLAYAGSAFGVQYSASSFRIESSGQSIHDSLRVFTSDEPGLSSAGYQGGDRGWNLLGNPYPLNLNVSTLLQNNNSGNFGAAYTFDGNGFVFRNASGIGDFDILRPFQAFWIQSDSSSWTPGDSFLFDQSSQVQTDGLIYKTQQNPEYAEVELEWPNGYLERFYLQVRSDADSLFDRGIDVLKWKSLSPGYVHVYSVGADSLPLGLDAFNSNRSWLDLRIETESPAQVRINFKRFSKIFGADWWLEDRFTGIQYSSIDSSISTTYDPAKGSRRFRVHFKPKDLGHVAGLMAVPAIRSEPEQWVFQFGDFFPKADWNVQIYDLSGRLLRTSTCAGGPTCAVDCGDLPRGFYIARCTMGGHSSSQMVKRL